MNTKVGSFLTLPALLLVLSLTLPLHAGNIDERIPDQQTLTQMEAYALQAPAREQCFLYAELVHTMTELAGQQMLAGDTARASESLKKAEQYSQLIQMSLARDTKRLKNAELLMHHTTRRLGEYLRAASGEDRPVLQATLKQLDQVQDDLLKEVFAH